MTVGSTWRGIDDNLSAREEADERDDARSARNLDAH